MGDNNVYDEQLPDQQDQQPDQKLVNLPWDEAIAKVLEESNEALTYAEIAEQIQNKNYRYKFGQTPANTVASRLSMALRGRAEIPVIQAGPNAYVFNRRVGAEGDAGQANFVEDNADETADDNEKVERAGAITAFGMYWLRSAVDWNSTNPRILGKQQAKSEPIDFSEQSGVYLLYDHDKVIYVGKTSRDRLSQRLKAHTKGQLDGRWDRFSWFGVRSLNWQSDLEGNSNEVTLNENDMQIRVDDVISALEAILIETIEPGKNNRRGDNFDGIEYIQEKDPAVGERLKNQQYAKIIAALKALD